MVSPSRVDDRLKPRTRAISDAAHWRAGMYDGAKCVDFDTGRSFEYYILASACEAERHQ